MYQIESSKDIFRLITIFDFGLFFSNKNSKIDFDCYKQI